MDTIADAFNKVFGDIAQQTESETMDTLSKNYSELQLKNGKLCGLGRMMFTTGIFVGIGKFTYSHRYCYHTLRDALDAFQNWDGKGDPKGFIVRKGLGADYNPNDPLTKGVALK